MVTRQGATEPAFSGQLYPEKRAGMYQCVCCGENLFTSETKYDSGSGWPSFFRAAPEGGLRELTDVSHGMRRVEIRCPKCDSHLGHVFEDGPPETGLRYCVNSLSLSFEPEASATEEKEPTR